MALHLWLTAGMLVFTGMGLCCAAAGGHRDGARRLAVPSGAGWMALMLAAMADIAGQQVHLLPGAAWALILLLAGPLSVALSHRGAIPVVHDPLKASMHLHRGLSLLVMGALVLLMHADPAAQAVPAAAHSHGGGPVPLLLAAGLGSYLLFSARLSLRLYRVRAVRRGSRAHLIEALSSVAAAACMIVMAMQAH
ncbi:hypothetical protein LVY72_11415 [Arthrobacter sp. I2-34]|uniref:DUF5134 domain-containing protein n=1 Tax=Arthrobacter hankyongi TaxID=2904801 RepID=A0ABS9L7C3_9MICC|nr:hypothetical protein [Arthrobacter hankyongi]MCG2622521.1 hypothetical protein [Arthrobacter hankyongi]